MFPKIFDIFLALSFIAVIFVVLRLYNALKVLNARVTILSSLVKRMSATMQEMEGGDGGFSEYEQKEQQLRAEMSRDFTYKDFSYEEIRKVKAQSLVRPDAAVRATGSFMAVGTKAEKELQNLSVDDEQEPGERKEGSQPLSI